MKRFPHAKKGTLNDLFNFYYIIVTWFLHINYRKIMVPLVFNDTFIDFIQFYIRDNVIIRVHLHFRIHKISLLK
jgi:hypothetical protein